MCFWCVFDIFWCVLVFSCFEMIWCVLVCFDGDGNDCRVSLFWCVGDALLFWCVSGILGLVFGVLYCLVLW